MRKLLIVSFVVLFAWASNFSQGIRLFKKGAYEEAKPYFERAYDEGIATAGYFLGLYYLRGLGGTKKDFDQAKRYLDRAISIGNVRAECALAELYLLQNQVELARGIIEKSSAKECQVLKNRLKKDR